MTKSGLPAPAAPPAEEPTEATHASFAGHVFDVRREQLTRAGVPVSLAPKPKALLAYLIRHPERVIGKPELLAAIWGNTVVTDDSLVQAVLDLRKALQDREQHVLKTVPKRGYMLAVPVDWSSEPPRSRPAARYSVQLKIGALATIMMCVVAAIAIQLWPQDAHVDDAALRRFPVFVAPLLEDDFDRGVSALGGRIAGDVSAELLGSNLRVVPSASLARLVISGRILRRGLRGVTVELQLEDRDEAAIAPLIRATFASDDEVTGSDLPVRVVRAMLNRRDEIILARARQPGHRPDDVELLYLAWNDYNTASTENDLDRASTRFDAVLGHDPTSVFARVGLSVSCLQVFTRLYSVSPRTTLSQCEKRVRDLYARAPGNPDAMQAMAFMLHVSGRPDDGIWLLQKSLEIAPLHRMGNALMASVLAKQGRFEDAEPYLELTRSWSERRTEHGPSDERRQSYFYQLFADVAFLQGRDDEAYRWLARWAAEMPDNGRPYLMLAAIDALHGRNDEAKAHMARHRELLPKSTMRYVEMLYPSSNPAIIAQRDRLITGLRMAGLPQGIR
jgi:DNA-binding winged helix-turn-helix (wHTH) protein/tetratricopeptide (TPR) repeat protein